MSESSSDSTPLSGPGIGDEELPEELRPTDDNPLAQPLEEQDNPRSPDELDVLGGKPAEQSGEGSGSGDEDDTDESGA